jgi:hypothetical protein
MKNFVLVLFKNKKKKKIIKGYSTEKNALIKYNQLIEESNNIDFEVIYENGKRVDYEIGLISKVDDYQLPLYVSDEIGRNSRVFISDDKDYVIKKIDKFKKQEFIYDWQKECRVTMTQIIKDYCGESGIKLISSLHNKIIIQNDSKFYVFSLKNSEESERFIQYLEKYYLEKGYSDTIFVRDIDTTQRKWLYDLLENNGFSRDKLYRKYTNLPK